MRKKNNTFVTKGGGVGAERRDHNDKPAQRDSHSFKHGFGGFGTVSSQRHVQVRRALSPRVSGGRKGRTRNRTDWRAPAPLRNSEGGESASRPGAGAGSEHGRGKDPRRPDWWLSPEAWHVQTPHLAPRLGCPRNRSPDSGVSMWGPHQAQCWRGRKETQGGLADSEGRVPPQDDPPGQSAGSHRSACIRNLQSLLPPTPLFQCCFLSRRNILPPFSAWAPTQPPNPAQRAPPL